ncbi:MAG: peptidoglycan DD-metalloendopeptidase family protein [Xanthomonadales bacterium]|nr:peptidoglycan DD-metalloendopeptidase family protein [Xanthomonadales bacterium]
MRLLTLLCLMLALGGCFLRDDPVRPEPRPNSRPAATPRPSAAKIHVVQSGDTLYAIARRYGVDFRELARWNKISAPYTIYPKQRLQVSAPSRTASSSGGRPAARPSGKPSTARTAPVPTRPTATPTPTPPKPTPAATPSPTAVPAKPPAATPAANAGGGSWRWPTEGSVIRGFVANDPGRQGIKIAGEAGQPVRAARDGQVVYSGAGLVGYGELVIVKHAGGYLTAYGHNRRRLVQEGEQVKAGQPIAELGRTGTDREMLHFEIRVGGKPVDPLPLLQGR